MGLRFELRGVRYFRENRLWFIASIGALALLPGLLGLFLELLLPLSVLHLRPWSFAGTGLSVWYSVVLYLAFLPVVWREKADTHAQNGRDKCTPGFNRSLDEKGLEEKGTPEPK
jgi:hypothetical protein